MTEEAVSWAVESPSTLDEAHRVYDLWLRRMPVTRIARELSLPLTRVVALIETAREQANLALRGMLVASVAEQVAVRQRLSQEAWELADRLLWITRNDGTRVRAPVGDRTAKAALAALQLVSDQETRIEDMLGLDVHVEEPQTAAERSPNPVVIDLYSEAERLASNSRSLTDLPAWQEARDAAAQPAAAPDTAGAAPAVVVSLGVGGVVEVVSPSG